MLRRRRSNSARSFAVVRARSGVRFTSLFIDRAKPKRAVSRECSYRASWWAIALIAGTICHIWPV